MAISMQLLLSDYERARAAGDADRAKSIFKEMEKIGLPDRLKPKSKPRRTSAKAKKQTVPTGPILDPGRF
jgi:hypothetical protein